ncbi:MAG: pyridoxal-phosphate dependent enzyme [Proteobacteria bacterium]|nr:pyridoxal-phosphate dependent enzyme [Pseudomonadota bacterium]
MPDLVSLADIKAARSRLPAAIRRTPIVPISRSSAEIGDERLFVKAENLQVTGAYKVRAAFTMLDRLDPAARAKGVVLASSGNFAQGFAYAGRQTGVPIAVVMLDRTSAYKVEATQGHGAEVIFCGTDAAARQPTVNRIAAERGMTAIDTWEEYWITAGHASIGVEICEDFPDVEQILVPVSSGGAAGGTAAAVKLLRPDVKCIGVQPVRANAAYVSRQAGKPTAIDYWDSIADGLSAIRPGEQPFRHLQTYLDDIVLVSEPEIGRAFEVLLTRGKLVGEPAGVVATAAFLAGKVDTSLKTVAVLTGGNLTAETMQKLMQLARG